MPIHGVMWCVNHHGIADECADGEICDMHDADGDNTPCDLRDLFIREHLGSLELS
jgi:hypothetical protein